MAVMGLRLAGRSNARGQAARRREPRDVRRPLARRARRRGADHLDHQRRARHTWVAPEMADLLTRARAARSGTRPRPTGGSGWHDARDDELWRAREQARDAAGGVRPGTGSAASSCARGLVRLGRRRGPTAVARPEGPHHRLRPPVRHLQAGHAAAVAARPAARRSCSTATGPCSSCSPASPTRPTTAARS